MQSLPWWNFICPLKHHLFKSLCLSSELFYRVGNAASQFLWVCLFPGQISSPALLWSFYKSLQCWLPSCRKGISYKANNHMKIKCFTSQKGILSSTELIFLVVHRSFLQFMMLPINNLFSSHHLFHNTYFQFATILGSFTQYYFPRSEHVSTPAVQNGPFHHS